MRSLQLALLEQDLAGIQAYLDEFDPPENGEDREVELTGTDELVVVRNFPLPDVFHPDYIDLLLIASDYPSRPPIGIYLLERNNEELIRQLRGIFNVMRHAAHEAPSVDGFAWICLHYQGNGWHFNPNRLAAGDNLRKFLIHFHNSCQIAKGL